MRTALNGYINKKGDWIVKPTYLKASAFQDGAAFAQKANHEFCLLNPQGKVIADFEANEVSFAFGDGFLGFKTDGKWGFINKSDKIAISLMFDKVAGPFFAIDKSGKTLFSARCDLTIPRGCGIISIKAGNQRMIFPRKNGYFPVPLSTRPPRVARI